MKSPPLPKTEVLDLRGLKCPLPALLARRALARAPAGQAIEILTDDPMAPIDVPHMCTQEGYEVMATEKDGTTTRIRMRANAAFAPSTRGAVPP